MANKTCLADALNFDPVEHLKEEDDVAAYLAVILEENDPALLAVVLGDIARERETDHDLGSTCGIGSAPWKDHKGSHSPVDVWSLYPRCQLILETSSTPRISRLAGYLGVRYMDAKFVCPCQLKLAKFGQLESPGSPPDPLIESGHSLAVALRATMYIQCAH